MFLSAYVKTFQRVPILLFSIFSFRVLVVWIILFCYVYIYVYMYSGFPRLYVKTWVNLCAPCSGACFYSFSLVKFSKHSPEPDRYVSAFGSYNHSFLSTRVKKQMSLAFWNHNGWQTLPRQRSLRGWPLSESQELAGKGVRPLPLAPPEQLPPVERQLGQLQSGNAGASS